MQIAGSRGWQCRAWWMLLVLLCVRLLLMIYLPLTDTTEARYAELARKILETGNWITLQHDYGVPFWAKPPLSSWLSACSMALLGDTAFSARLPSLLLALGVVALTADLAFRRHGKDAALTASLVLASSLLFFISAGAVMTDPALLFGTTLSLAAFWHAQAGRRGAWSYLFFVGIGIGLLSKGPIALVLVGLPIIAWVTIRRRWRVIWASLPWMWGGLLTLVIALPWYLIAEMKTPGFLHYFILGEHLGRFLDAGWSGDRYGFAHAAPRGIIWLYALGALLPWGLYAPVWWFRRSGSNAQDGWSLYLLLWTVMTPAFFSLSGNVIFPYVLPMLPGAALLLIEWRSDAPTTHRISVPSWLAAPTIFFFGGILAFQAWKPELLPSHKMMIARWEALQSEPGGAFVYWGRSRLFSAEFYSRGRARTTHDADVLRQLLVASPRQNFLVIREGDAYLPPAELLAHFDPVSRVRIAGDQWLLLRDGAATRHQFTSSEG